MTSSLLALASCLPSQLGGQSRQSYAAPLVSYEPEAVASQVVEVREAAPAVGIRSQMFEPEVSGAFRYAFETENDIKQSAEGSLRTVGDVEVVVMKGEYSYLGADGNEWKVEWYADETGFHPSAPFLPKSVEPLHPEIVAAVRDQLAFAAQEDARAARSY